MRIVAISDTHGHHAALDLPEGDVLVHAGDFCGVGGKDETLAFFAWLGQQTYRHKVLIAGNHDMWVEKELAEARRQVPSDVTFLNDEACEIDGLRFWGSPWTPMFYDWAFMLPRGEMLRAKWAEIPDETDVLITHGPPYGHGDQAPPHLAKHPSHVGCWELLQAVRRVNPRLHLFGHIHQGYGISKSDEVIGTLFANAASCSEAYQPDHAPLVIDL